MECVPENVLHMYTHKNLSLTYDYIACFLTGHFKRGGLFKVSLPLAHLCNQTFCTLLMGVDTGRLHHALAV